MVESELCGLDEPYGRASNALRMGTFVSLRTATGGRAKKMMISAFLWSEKKKDESVFVLLTPHCHTSDLEFGDYCSLKKGNKTWNFGKIIDPQEIFERKIDETEGNSENSFVIVELDEVPLFNYYYSSALRISVVKDFQASIWSGCFRVRRLNDDEYIESIRRLGKGQPRWRNARGRAIGEIRNVEVEDGNSLKVYDYCGVVAAKRGRSVGGVDDVGAPIVSRNGALAGIIVGQASGETLILPAEMIPTKDNFHFVTLGGDWPRVLVKS